jgi:flagellar basal-body rod protein FlgB
MRFNLDKAMGVHEQALYVRAQRVGVIASNLANADTPNYKARDIDFRQAMKQAKSGGRSSAMAVTHKGHIQAGGGKGVAGSELLYRTPHQPSLDGNTVDAQQEKARYTENAMQYQTSLQFLTSRFQGLTKAIKGGQ